LIADIQGYMTGRKVDFATVALDLTDIGPFQGKVYAAARSVPWGQTASYGELARQAGSPGAARAVGHALSRNPVPIIIPCHRILAKGHRIGGFSAHGGIVTKARLLALEGVRVDAGTPLLPGII
jgi:methylated-DNA-[protein]-cysteine S-methyltransferase